MLQDMQGNPVKKSPPKKGLLQSEKPKKKQ